MRFFFESVFLKEPRRRRVNQLLSHRNQFFGHLLFVIEIAFNIQLLHKNKINTKVCSWFHLLRKKRIFHAFSTENSE